MICLLISIIWWLSYILFRDAPEWDNMEELVWANSFEIGYQKHPPLPTWILYPLTKVFGKVLWLPIALGLLSVFATQVISYFLYRDIQANATHQIPSYAPLVAVLTASPIIYYTIRGGDFNHNATQLWAIAAMFLFYYRAWKVELCLKKYLYWAGFGACCGVAFLSKYSVLIQMGVLLGHFFIIGQWKNPRALTGALISILSFFALTSAHFLWLYEQTLLRQGPIFYAEMVMQDQTNYWMELINLFTGFMMTQIYRLMPILVVIFMLRKLQLKTSKISHNLVEKTWWQNISKGDQLFLLMITIGPSVLAMCIGIFLDVRIEAKWAVTFFISIGTVGWMFVRSDLNLKKLISWVLAGHLIFALLYGVVTGVVANAVGHQGRNNYPSKELSSRIQARWEEHPEVTAGQPMRLIVGDTWTAGNVMLHSPKHGTTAKVLIDADLGLSPWLTIRDLNQPMMVVINRPSTPLGKEIRQSEPVAQIVNELFLNASIKGRESIPWTTHQEVPPLEIDWAIIPFIKKP
ncbi:MAG: glycosyltransferase family 39 protein [Betaproteobacteria bacterium]